MPDKQTARIIVTHKYGVNRRDCACMVPDGVPEILFDIAG